MDINVLLEILDHMSADDILSYCSTSSNLFRLCNKYSNVIWERMLWKDYKIPRDQIIGTPKSYYFGLKNNQGYYYFYDLDKDYESNRFTVERIELISKEDSKWDSHFYVPGIDEPKEKVIVGIVTVTLENHGSEDMTVVGKTLNEVKKTLAAKIHQNLLDFDYEIIQNIPLNTTFRENMVDDFNAREYQIQIQFFEASL